MSTETIPVKASSIAAFDERRRSESFILHGGEQGNEATISAKIDGKTEKRKGYLHRAGSRRLHSFVLKKKKR